MLFELKRRTDEGAALLLEMKQGRKTLFVVTSGDGAERDEREVHGVFSTREKAEEWRRQAAKTYLLRGGPERVLCPLERNEVEEWAIDPEYEPHPDAVGEVEHVAGVGFVLPSPVLVGIGGRDLSEANAL